MNTVRTTIRIKKDLLDQSRLLALRMGTSLQHVINNTLAIGFNHVTDLDTTREAIEKIDKFRKSLKSKNINLQKLLDESRQSLK